VLLLSQDGNVTIGTPDIQGARVIGEVEKQGRGEKIVVFKFKSKTRQGTKTGHRQALTRLRITDIVAASAPRARRRRRSQEPAEESNDGS